ncbi:hypothetical protein HHK36_010757 [Tetracentron sinense]|uniref:HMG box domain-containing protein n=1 Tax=Tetracentron sinense TaxID=13715 RepID=A0A834ZCH5_TETSI|nr:hypothetical protein HHK36_010757 [Tetracentron sinense]
MKAAKGKGVARRDTKEALKLVEDKKVGKRKAALKADKSSKKPAKKVKLAKDPNKPKRPPSAFFVFLEEFRKIYKQEHPNVKGVAAKLIWSLEAATEGWESWRRKVEILVWRSAPEFSAADSNLIWQRTKHLFADYRFPGERVIALWGTDLIILSVWDWQEKAPYEAKAAKRKSEHEKLMSAYNKKQESMADDGDEESDRSKSEVNDEDNEESGEGFGSSEKRRFIVTFCIDSVCQFIIVLLNLMFKDGSDLEEEDDDDNDED